MPKWVHHRGIAKTLCLQLSKKEMENIDSTLDGMIKGYAHDFWRYDTASLTGYLERVCSLYGIDGLKYCLLHILLDTLQALIVSEKTRETLGAKLMRAYAHEIAFMHAVGVMELHVRDCLQEHGEIFEQFLNEAKSKEKEIAHIVSELPEVKAQIKIIEKFKSKRKRAEEIARRYGAKGFNIPLYTSFILELWNERKRGAMTKEAWTNKVLEKYRSLKGAHPEIYDNFLNIAKSLGYIR